MRHREFNTTATSLFRGEDIGLKYL